MVLRPMRHAVALVYSAAICKGIVIVIPTKKPLKAAHDLPLRRKMVAPVSHLSLDETYKIAIAVFDGCIRVGGVTPSLLQPRR